MKTIYQKMVEVMNLSEITNHESDLYVKVCDDSTKIVNEYKFKSNVTVFRDNVTGCLYYDIPFAFDPFYKKQINK